MANRESLTYQKAGVDPEKAGRILGSFAGFLKTRPRDPSILAGIGPYASCYSLKDAFNRFEDPVLVTCCDGVGTKAKLALEWGKIDTLGEDLVAMNVNDLLCVGAMPTLFLDYYACGKLEENQLLPLLKSIQHGCELARCSLVGGETAEMPGVYSGEDFDLAGFSVGLVDRKGILGAERVQAGDVLLALASSGPHSNGYSLIRKVIERERLDPDARVPFGEGSWREVLLRPTTIYVPHLHDLMPRLHALAHITGGGLFENLPRVLPAGTVARISSKDWRLPPLFQWLQEKAAIDTRQLLSTFNNGVGMIAICSQDEFDGVRRTIESRGVACWVIGEIEDGKSGEPAVVSWE